MVRRTLPYGLVVGLAGVLLSSCGGSGKPRPRPLAKGSLVTFVGDAPFCDILSFRASITDMTLTVQGGTRTARVLPLNALIKVNLAQLRDFSTFLSLTGVDEGTYDSATINFSAPQIIVFDPTNNPPVTTITGTFSTLKPKVPIEPALTLKGKQLSALRMDFDMLRSIEVDAQGQVTGKVTPVIRLIPLTASASEGFAELDDVVGFVENVSTFSTGQGFIGGFTMQLFSGTGSAVTVNLTSSTALCGPQTTSNAPCTPVPLDEVLTGSFVEVEGFVDQKGNFVAKSVEVEDREIVEQNQVAFVGYVTSLTKDASGNVAGFNLYVREEEPDVSLSVFLDSVNVVTLSSSTAFQFSSRATNFANLPFDTTTLTPGQEVVVHGKFTKPPAPPPPAPPPPATIAADKVYLKLQAVQGAFTSLVQAGSDDLAGAFWLAPCFSFFQGAPILVFTSSQTTFVNVSGLSALTPLPALLVKGLPFFEPKGTTINGVTVPAGTLVLLAKQVHQLS